MPRSSIKIDATRTFGIEIEAYGATVDAVCTAMRAAGLDCRPEGYNHATRLWWKVVSDGSIQDDRGRGGEAGLTFELVSPILCGAEGLAQIRIVCQVLESLGAQVNKSCGLHVHHGTRDLTLDNWKSLCKYWLKYETTLDTLQPVSRRLNTNTLLKSLLYRRWASLAVAFTGIDRATTLEELSHIVCSRDRYYKLNLEAFWRHGTVEVRHHSGTVDAEKICHWVSLTQGMVLAAMADHGERHPQLADIQRDRAAGLSYRALDERYGLLGNNGTASYRLCNLMGAVQVSGPSTLKYLVRTCRISPATVTHFTARQAALA